MKFITFIIIIFSIYGCGDPYPQENRFVVFEKGGRGQVDSITYFKDTMIVYRSFRLYNADTLFMRLIPNIKIGTHKGDIITGDAVKNVYNKP